MSTAEIKKPPVAPKPTFAVGHKTVPPPVAPKPDILLADVLQTVKKTKPAIAPKPKILKCSSVPEVNTIPPSLRKNSRSLEDPKKDSSEFLLHLNYKNGMPRDNAAYIISVCSCKFECVHKFGNGENLYKNPTIFEQLENLENIGTDEQSASSSLKTRTELDIHNGKKMNKNRAVLNTNLLEEKFKDVLTQSIFSNSSHLKQKPLNKLEMGNFNSFNDYVNVELTDFVPVASSPEEVMDCPNNHINIACVESERTEIPPLTENISSCSCSLDTPLEKTDNSESHMSTSTKGGNESFPSSGTDSVPSAKSLPVPKPRKLRASGLIRQDGIDIPGERIKETFASECETMGFSDCAVGKTEKSNVLVQSVSYNNQKHTPESNKSKIASCVAGKMYLVAESLESDSKEMTPQNFLPGGSHQGENVEHSFDLYSTNSSNDLGESNSMLAVNDKNASFIRSSNLSKSLPKQLKLSCNQDLPAFESLHNFAQEKENKNDHLKGESSTKIIPKKPQRQSIPGTGLLKKAASEELLERSTYLSNEEHSQTPLEGPRIRHLSAKEQSSLLSQNLPKLSLEKPAWKLPHPILPFSGNPEALKNTKNAKNSEFRTPLTKPRAKSLSSVDMDRIHKPPKEPPKKNSLKKFLNIKLSICLMKSDFQKFLIKSSQPTDNTTVAFSHQEELGKNWNVTNMINRRKTKPAKAHSAEVGILSLQKGKEKSRSQDDATKSQRSKSFDEQTFSSQRYLSSLTHDYIPEYENVSHYEEIPEYENLPFASADKKACYEWHNSKILEDHDANVYEVEELYEPTRICSKFGRSLAEDLGGSDLVLEDVHSDDELILRDVSSSDEDADTNSDSSKGELDTQENEQINTAGKKTKVYYIAKEIMSSEKVFVDVLKLLHIDFRDAVTHASRQLGKPVIEDRILNQILYYLPQLYELNRDLLRELEERLSRWIDNQRIADIFVKKGHYLKMYSTYIKEFDRNVTLLDEQCRKNPGFAAVVRDFEMSPRCANLALKHYLLKPVQRIPQYRLLLTDYLKNLSEDSADFRDTNDALAVVIEVANHANDIMKQGDNFQKLMQIQYSLNGHHEIVQPGRVFLKEGTLMKLSRKVMQPRMFFLFNDALLYTTPMQSGVYKLNNMLSLAGMKVRKPIHEAYQNELNIESVERSFILSANSATERDEWLEAISRSIEDYTKKRITFNPSKSLEEGDLEKEEEASPIGSKAPIWIPDTRATMCMICTSEFTLTWRRHHCRACGKIICQACSSNKHRLDYMKNNPARVCDLCFKELQKQDNLCTSPKNGSPVSHRSPSNALSTVLHSIPSGRKQKKIPAALKEVSASIEDSSMSGYLYRSKGNKKPWKHLWFVIKNKVLYTYAASEDVAALESQPLLGFTVAEVKDEHLEPKVFHLMHKNTLFYIFKADDPHSMQKWIEAFQEATIL